MQPLKLQSKVYLTYIFLYQKISEFKQFLKTSKTTLRNTGLKNWHVQYVASIC